MEHLQSIYRSERERISMSNIFYSILLLLNCIQQCSLFIYFRHNTELEWSYHGETGTRQWCSLFPSCCGRFQSPINFRIENTVTQRLKLTPETSFNFSHYDIVPNSMTVENSGHTVLLMINDPKVKPKLSGGNMNKTYNFHSLHFHWGSHDRSGSEHTFGGQRFPIEMHMVHYSEEFSNLTSAIQSAQKDSVAVLGIVFNIGWFNNTALSRITNELESIRHRGQKTKLAKPFKLSKLFSPDTDQFFRYSGSLTTPTCDQVVVWTVFGVPSFISESQLKQFRRLLASKKGEEPPRELSDNYRPLQPMYNRAIYTYNG